MKEFSNKKPQQKHTKGTESEREGEQGYLYLYSTT